MKDASMEARGGARVELSHGSGGRATLRMVRELFLRHLGNPALEALDDGAVLDFPGGTLAVSTDGFVVDPLFFPGGDIGKLAACGTLNDLAMCGAEPRALTAAFILEEGLELKVLERVVASMAEQTRAEGVPVVTGDTKVVPRGKGDGLFITTTGVGRVLPGVAVGSARIQAGDRLLLSGPVGDHGTTILALRAGIELGGSLCSDCAPVARAVLPLLKAFPEVHALRDPTRGGLAAVLNEFAEASRIGLQVRERDIPISPDTRAACDLLGLDPLNMACEGRFLAALPAPIAEAGLKLLRSLPGGAQAALIGAAVADHPGQVVARTSVGGTRLLGMLDGEPLPRIC
jgi:hydrogenase expression/formation protein HypE